MSTGTRVMAKTEEKPTASVFVHANGRNMRPSCASNKKTGRKETTMITREKKMAGPTCLAESSKIFRLSGSGRDEAPEALTILVIYSSVKAYTEVIDETPVPEYRLRAKRNSKVGTIKPISYFESWACPTLKILPIRIGSYSRCNRSSTPSLLVYLLRRHLNGLRNKKRDWIRL